MKKINVDKLKGFYDLARNQYEKAHKRMMLLDSVDRGDFWAAFKAKYPSYQILPDTNFVNYVKSNILASIYTVTKSAEVLPTSEADKELILNLNVALDNIWNLSNVGHYQFQAGERASLLNVGYTQVGWDDHVTGGSGDSFYKGNVVLKNVDPIKFMRDPYAIDLESSSFCMTYENYHKSVFLRNPNYADEFKKYEQSGEGMQVDIPMQSVEHNRKGACRDNHTLFIYWVRDGEDINEYHVINNEHLLFTREKIVPNCFPFAELHCELPAGDLIGVSPPAKILANNIAYNLMDSIALTAEYKNQRPPKFINGQSGINIQQFVKHGEEADKTFIVNGDASRAVHYHQFPQPSNVLPTMKQGLERSVETVSGVDGRYTGRDTGSIITTGGTEEMLNRVTLIDTPKVMNYEKYTKQLTQLILANFIEFSPARKYFYRPNNQVEWESKEVDFPNIDSSTLFNYQIAISSELPKNKQRLAAMANMLMEKQMQYAQQGSQVQLITEEEWLMFQDIPNKEYMLERMGVQRLQDAVEDASQVLTEYAALVQQGMESNDALMAVSQNLKDKRAGLSNTNSIDAMGAQADMGTMPEM